MVVYAEFIKYISDTFLQSMWNIARQMTSLDIISYLSNTDVAWMKVEHRNHLQLFGLPVQLHVIDGPDASQSLGRSSGLLLVR